MSVDQGNLHMNQNLKGNRYRFDDSGKFLVEWSPQEVVVYSVSDKPPNVIFRRVEIKSSYVSVRPSSLEDDVAAYNEVSHTKQLSPKSQRSKMSLRKEWYEHPILLAALADGSIIVASLISGKLLYTIPLRYCGTPLHLGDYTVVWSEGMSRLKLTTHSGSQSEIPFIKKVTKKLAKAGKAGSGFIGSLHGFEVLLSMSTAGTHINIIRLIDGLTRKLYGFTGPPNFLGIIGGYVYAFDIASSSICIWIEDRCIHLNCVGNVTPIGVSYNSDSNLMIAWMRDSGIQCWNIYAALDGGAGHITNIEPCAVQPRIPGLVAVSKDIHIALTKNAKVCVSRPNFLVRRTIEDASDGNDADTRNVHIRDLRREYNSTVDIICDEPPENTNTDSTAASMYISKEDAIQKKRKRSVDSRVIVTAISHGECIGHSHMEEIVSTRERNLPVFEKSSCFSSQATLIRQAILGGDTPSLLRFLEIPSPKIIYASCRELTGKEAFAVLRLICPLVQRTPSIIIAASSWVKALLCVHMAHLSMTPGIRRLLSPVVNLLGDQASDFSRLCVLNGRIQTLLNILDHAEIEREKDPVLIQEEREIPDMDSLP